VLQNSTTQQIGKSVARDLVATFRNKCVKKVKDKTVEFGPRQLEAGYVLCQDIILFTGSLRD